MPDYSLSMTAWLQASQVSGWWQRPTVAERLGVRTVQASHGGGRQAAPSPLLTAQEFGKPREARRSRCTPHKMPRLGRRADRQKKTASKSRGGKNLKSLGRRRARVQRWVSRRAKAGAIVTTTFSAGADWQADTRL